MKTFIINSNILKGFGTMGAEFYTLLKKGEYEEILKLYAYEIKEKINKMGLTNRDIINLNRIIYQEFKSFAVYFNLFEGHSVYSPEYFKRITDKVLKEKAEIKNLEIFALRKNYVLLTYILRYSISKLKQEQIILKKNLKHSQDLLLKLEGLK